MELWFFLLLLLLWGTSRILLLLHGVCESRRREGVRATCADLRISSWLLVLLGCVKTKIETTGCCSRLRLSLWLTVHVREKVILIVILCRWLRLCSTTKVIKQIYQVVLRFCRSIRSLAFRSITKVEVELILLGLLMLIHSSKVEVVDLILSMTVRGELFEIESHVESVFVLLASFGALLPFLFLALGSLLGLLDCFLQLCFLLG